MPHYKTYSNAAKKVLWYGSKEVEKEAEEKEKEAEVVEEKKEDEEAAKEEKKVERKKRKRKRSSRCPMFISRRQRFQIFLDPNPRREKR